MRPLIFLAALLSAGFSQAQDVVLFHETFDDTVGFTQFPGSFDSDQSSNGNAWSYWGIWDPVGSLDDFGSGPTPNPGPVFTGYDGNALIGRRMNGGGNGSNFSEFIANPGVIEWYNLDMQNALPSAVSIVLAAYRTNNQGNTFNASDFVRVSWKSSSETLWAEIFFLSG